jgi:hypothetical protein
VDLCCSFAMLAGFAVGFMKVKVDWRDVVR